MICAYLIEKEGEMSNNQNDDVKVGGNGLKKHNIKVSTVVFMIFCLSRQGATVSRK